MANVTIVKTGNSLIVDFGVYVSSGSVDSVKSGYSINDLIEIDLTTDLSHLLVMMRDSHGKGQWELTYDPAYVGSEYFIVDLVDGVAPTTQLDLFNKLNALR